jgi:TRAP-type C4-dicarboxylate transport system permease small subunit
MTLVIWGQVFYRYVLNYGIPWAEEVARFLLVWLGFLGSAIVFYEQGHVSIDFIIEKFPSNSIRWIKIFHLLLSLFFFIFLIKYGYDYAIFGKKLVSPATGISRFWAQLAVPVGSLFLILHSITLIYKRMIIKINKEKFNHPDISKETEHYKSMR